MSHRGWVMSTAPDSPLRVESPPTGAKKHSGRPFVFLERDEGWDAQPLPPSPFPLPRSIR
jgi:hypothetical protein